MLSFVNNSEWLPSASEQQHDIGGSWWIIYIGFEYKRTFKQK